jgi:hypothetical protein
MIKEPTGSDNPQLSDKTVVLYIMGVELEKSSPRGRVSEDLSIQIKL